MLKGLQALDYLIKNFEQVEEFGQCDYNGKVQKKVLTILKKEYEVFEIIDRHPEELCFVISSETYEDYLKTYETLGEKFTPAITKKEFSKLKKHFKDVIV